MTELRAPTPLLRAPASATPTALAALAAVTVLCVGDVAVGVYVVGAVALLASAAAAGLALFTAVFGVPDSLGRRWRAATCALTVGAFAASLVTVALSVADVAGAGIGGITDRTAGSAVLRGGIYSAALTRCVGLTGIAMAIVARRPPRLLLVAAAIVTSGSLLLTGHVRDHGPAVVVVICALAHVMGAAAWLGGLVGIGVTLGRGVPSGARAQLLRSFAGLMTGVVAMIVAGGVGLALLYLRSPSALVTTAYGQVLLVKSGLVAATLVASAANHRRLVPLAARGERAALTVLRTNVAVEQIAVVTVLLITEVLMRQSPVSG